MVGSGLQTWQRGRQSGGSCGNDQSESPATKGPRRTYDVSRDRLTGCSSRGNVGLPRGGASCVVLPVATGRKGTFPIACSIDVGFGVGLAERGVRNRHLRCKIPSRTCLHWVISVIPAIPACPVCPKSGHYGTLVLRLPRSCRRRPCAQRARTRARRAPARSAARP